MTRKCQGCGNHQKLTRRNWLKLSASAALWGGSSCGWLSQLAAETSASSDRKRSCILLWMPGGPSQIDTFDMKPGHENGGSFQPIATSVAGVQISEHLPGLATQMEEMAIIRSMQTHEADHGRASFFLRTGYKPQAGIQYPSVGSLIAKAHDNPESALPACVSIASPRLASNSSYGSGYLGPAYAPMLVGSTSNLADFYNPDRYSDAALSVRDLHRPEFVRDQDYEQRLQLLNEFQQEFGKEHSGIGHATVRSAQERAMRLVSTKAVNAFDLSGEPPALREKYGKNLFGQSCLLARRLVERHVPFVEVTLGGWDTHIQNFTAVEQLSLFLNQGWSALMADLKDRGLLETTTIVWMGEFGRTPSINPQNGRDHFPTAWTTVLAGGGIKGGQVVGKTTGDGLDVADRPVAVPDLLATLCLSLGIDYLKQHPSNVSRPIRIVDKSATPIKEVLA